MAAWQRHLQSAIRQIGKRVECSYNPSANFSSSSSSRLEGLLPYFQTLCKPSSPTISRPLHQYFQHLGISSSRNLRAEEAPLPSPLTPVLASNTATNEEHKQKSLTKPDKVQAILKGIKQSPKKVNLVAALVRGMRVEDALLQLQVTVKRASKTVYQVIHSARANATHNHGLDPDRLLVAEAFVGKGFFKKRLSYHAKGKCGVKVRPECRLTVVVREITPDEEAEIAKLKVKNFIKMTKRERKLVPHQLIETTPIWGRKGRFSSYLSRSLPTDKKKVGEKERGERESVKASLAMAKEQLQVLNALDVARTQWYHFTAIIIAGMGFFTDAYDLFCVSLVTKLLGRIYYHVEGAKKPGTLPPNVSAAVNGVAFCGTLAGQLFFGWLGDKMGRKRVYGMTLMLMVICSIASGLSFGHTPKTVMSTLCFFRFWLGFGIGGDYPLSATIMSEYANKKTRGAFIAAVFAMQGFGILAGGIFAIICAAAFNANFDAPTYKDNALASTVPQADYLWRIIVMVGAIPAAMTYYWRMKMPETARYTALVAKNAKQAASDMSRVLQVEIEAETQKAEPTANTFALFSKEFMHRHGLHLLGTTSTWFLLDIAFYSQNLFQKDIFSAIGWIPAAETMNAIDEVYRIARAQTLIALCSTVPGYWFTVAFIDRIGRFAIQLMGFFFMTVFMFALAIPYDHWTHKDNRIGFVVIYSLTFFFANFGPNATTFVVPAEIFPARFRSTCHGISAASGKLGAIVGAFGFLYLAQNKDKTKTDAGYPPGIGVKNSLIVLGVVNFLGILFTFLVPESNGRSLEEMSGENEEESETGAVELEQSSYNNRTVPVV